MVESLSAALRRQYDDFQEMYKSAKESDNAPGMERLGKLISAQAKQIKEHEEHEGQTLTRERVLQLGVLLASCVSRSVKFHIKDEKLAADIMVTVHDEIKATIDGF